MTIRCLAAAFVLGFVGAAQAAPATPIQDNPRIRAGFYAYYLARSIESNCPEISLRRVKMLFELNTLRNYAQSVGYSYEDFKDLEDNEPVKAAFKTQLEGDLASRGATPGNTSAYCRVGQEEIAAGTLAGRLMKD